MANGSRVQVGRLGPERLRPAAAPVDRFVAPERGGRLAQVAEGLARFAPSLARFADTVQTAENQAQMLEGSQEAQALIDSQVTYKEAVRRGLIRRDQNPWFRLGMKKRFASVASGAYIAHLSRHAKQWAENSTNPEDFAHLEAELRHKWTEENIGSEGVDPVFASVFGETVNSQVAGIARNFANVAGENAVKQSLDMLGAEVYDVLNNDDLTLEERIQRIRDIDREAVQEMLLPGDKVTDAIAQAVIDTAIQTKDYSLLGVRMTPQGTLEFTREGILHRLNSGTAKIGDIARIRDQIRQAAWEITQATEAEWAHAARAEQARRNEAERTVAANFAEAEDPLSPQFIREQADLYFAAGMPDMAQEILRLGNAAQTLAVEGDERYVDDLRTGVLMGEVGIRRLFRAAESGEISGRQLQSLMGTLTTYLNYRQATERDVDPLEHDYWKDGQKFVEKLAAGGLLSNISSIGVVQAWRAQTWARKRWLHWWYELDGRNKSPEEQRDELDRIFEATRELFFQDQMLTDDQRQSMNLGDDPLSTDWQNNRVLTRAETLELMAVVRREQEVPSKYLEYKLYRMGVDLDQYRDVALAQARMYDLLTPPAAPEGTDQEEADEPTPERMVVVDGLALTESERRTYNDLKRQYRGLVKEINRLTKIRDRVRYDPAKEDWQRQIDALQARLNSLEESIPDTWIQAITKR